MAENFPHENDFSVTLKHVHELRSVASFFRRFLNFSCLVESSFDLKKFRQTRKALFNIRAKFENR